MSRSIDTHKSNCPCPACRKKTGREKKPMSILMEPELHEWIKAEAGKTGKTMTEIIETGIRLQQQK